MGPEVGWPLHRREGGATMTGERADLQTHITSEEAVPLGPAQVFGDGAAQLDGGVAETLS